MSTCLPRRSARLLVKLDRTVLLSSSDSEDAVQSRGLYSVVTSARAVSCSADGQVLAVLVVRKGGTASSHPGQRKQGCGSADLLD